MRSMEYLEAVFSVRIMLRHQFGIFILFCRLLEIAMFFSTIIEMVFLRFHKIYTSH